MKILGYVNLVGVAILVALCSVQWHQNRLSSLKVVSLDQTCQEQARKIEDLQATVVAVTNDLESFRTRLSKIRDELDQTTRDLSNMTTARDQLVDERDRITADRDHLLAEREKLKMALQKWEAAVAAREAALSKANDEVIAIAKQRNESTERFNQLAAKYNGIVKDLNEARSRQADK